MSDEPNTAKGEAAVSSLSKRGARRVIQRAVVLLGRDKAFRQKVRTVQMNSRWSVEDWDLEWTVIVAQGRMEFHRGRTGRAHTHLRWKTGEDFLKQVELGRTPGDGFELECPAAEKALVESLLARFCATLKSVLADPVDDDGVRLA